MPTAIDPVVLTDLAHMRAAIALARRGLGEVWPNPTVGCVIVNGGRVVGRGWTQPGGRPHGETEALTRAGAAARDATAFVSLEPCCHWGKTPEAAEVNAGFLLRIREGRPLVTLKLATTLDGRIATHAGESQWITGPLARDRAHVLRASHDAVMVGSNTVIADDPLLTCRLPGLTHRSPVRVIVDSRLRVPLTARVVAEARQIPTWFVTLRGGDRLRQEAFRACGVELIEVDGDDGAGVDIGEGLRALGARGLTRVLAEGGSHLAASLLRDRLVDRLAWFRAPRLIGGDGLPAVAAFGLERLADAPGFGRGNLLEAGEDVLETYRRAT